MAMRTTPWVRFSRARLQVPSRGDATGSGDSDLAALHKRHRRVPADIRHIERIGEIGRPPASVHRCDRVRGSRRGLVDNPRGASR